MSREQEARIRAVAYRLWEEEGRPVGRDLDHWFQAQMMVLGISATVKPAKAAKPKAEKKASAGKPVAKKAPAAKTAKAAPKATAKAKPRAVATSPKP